MMRRETSEITNSVLKCGRKGSHEVGSVQCEQKSDKHFPFHRKPLSVMLTRIMG